MNYCVFISNSGPAHARHTGKVTFIPMEKSFHSFALEVRQILRSDWFI